MRELYQCKCAYGALKRLSGIKGTFESVQTDKGHTNGILENEETLQKGEKTITLLESWNHFSMTVPDNPSLFDAMKSGES